VPELLEPVLPEPELPELLEPPPKPADPLVPVPAPVPDMPPAVPPAPVLPWLLLLPLALASEPPLLSPRIWLHAETPTARASRLAINTLWCFRFMFNSF
jgi:hypothetical protein